MPQSKYRAKKTLINGITFDSQREAARYVFLKLEENKGLIQDLRLQVPYQLSVCKFKADFVYWKDGKEVVEDCKGFRTPTYRLKKKMMKHELSIEVFES